MKVISIHLQTLEIQVMESINIEKVSDKCLNLKSEWAGFKIPGLRVFRSKGCITTKEDLKGIPTYKLLEMLSKEVSKG